MVNRKKEPAEAPASDYKVLPPARTRDRRAQQLVNLAENLVEKRMLDGTASPTEVVAVLRLGTAREQADIERVRMHTEYLQAQKAKAESETVREELFAEAMEAFSSYKPSNG